MINKPGIYDVPMSEYHGREICPGPSISSSGLRELLRCPLKYWYNSPLNPERPPQDDTPAFALGRAAHDLVLDGEGWPSRYYVLPEGFDARATKKWADVIEQRDEAILNGLTVLKYDECLTVNAMAEAIKKHPISQVLRSGKAEQTIVWQDAETGVWCRCRPDFLPSNKQYIPDYKTCRSAHPDDFARDVSNYGYHQQAAFYLDGIRAVFGDADRHFYFIAQEKEAPYIVQPYTLEAEAIAWGRELNRKALKLFRQCLDAGQWPAYADDFVSVGLPRWQVEKLERDNHGVM